MIRRPPRSTRTDTLFPYTTLFRSYPIPFIERFLGEIGAEGGQPAIDEQQQDEELARREADVPFVVGDRPAGEGEYHRDQRDRHRVEPGIAQTQGRDDLEIDQDENEQERHAERKRDVKGESVWVGVYVGVRGVTK